MSLRSRLTLVVSALVTLVAVGVGGIAVTATYRAGLSRIDASLAAVSAAVQDTDGNATAVALRALEDEGLAATVASLSADRRIVTVRRSTVHLSTAPGEGALLRATVEPVTIAGRPDYRLRVVSLRDGHRLLIAASLAAIESARSDNLDLLLLASLLVIIIGITTMRLFIRADFRRMESLIQAAEKLSDGNMDVPLADGGGRAEVDQLSRALRRMVGTLRHAITTEREAHARMQRFLGDASHELRTPITVVKGYLDLLTDHDRMDAEAIDRAVARSAEEVERLEAMVRDLLLLAELSETQRMTLEPVDFRELVAKRFLDLRVIDPERPLALHLPAECHLVGDRRLLDSLVANLVSNLHRHTPADAVVEVVLQASDAVRLQIDDAGPGLPEERYGQEAEYFQRFDQSRSRAHGGSGLGLSIMAEVARLHGGTLRMDRSHLGGLRTIVTLPAASS